VKGATARADALGPVLDFMRLLWALDHALHRTSKRMAATLGVTGPQRLVIRIVGKFPAIPAGQLARLLHLHPSTLSGVLKRLETQGLLRRRTDPDDARRSLLSLSGKGRLVDAEMRGSVEAAIRILLRTTPRAQVRAARAVLAGIVLALESPSGTPRVPQRGRSRALQAGAGGRT
jgi:MarR family transcriptional regulator, organic hydroperoxide resistance regulator